MCSLVQLLFVADEFKIVVCCRRVSTLVGRIDVIKELATLIINTRLSVTDSIIWTDSQESIDYIHLAVVRVRDADKAHPLKVAITEPWSLEACILFFDTKHPMYLVEHLNKHLKEIWNLCGASGQAKGTIASLNFLRASLLECRHALGNARGSAFPLD